MREPQRGDEAQLDAEVEDRIGPRPVVLEGAGLTLAADEWGPHDRHAVVFLHGAGQNRVAWDESARAVVEAGWRAVTVDHRGHGDSDWAGEGGYEWDHFGDDLEAILATLDSKPVVVGASLGGMAALVAQGRTGVQLYRGLVLVDVVPYMNPAGVRRIVGFMSAHPEGFDTLEHASEVIAAYTGRPVPESMDGLRRVLRLDQDGRWRWHWDVEFLVGRGEVLAEGPVADRRAEEIRDELMSAARRVRVPTLVVRGERSDLVSPAAVRELCDVVPDARFVDVAEAGHMVAGDNNDLFTAAVLEFLATL